MVAAAATSQKITGMGSNPLEFAGLVASVSVV
jgi:hypothetical protein